MGASNEMGGATCGSAPNVNKMEALHQLGFAQGIDLSATATKSFDYTGISNEDDILFLSGYISMSVFQQWIARPLLAIAYRDSDGRLMTFARIQTTIDQTHLREFLRACVG